MTRRPPPGAPPHRQRIDPAERRPIMRFSFLAVLALSVCAPVSHGTARPITDRAGRQDQSPEITTFRGNEARDAAREQASRQEFLKLQGTWTCVRWEEGGQS